MKIGAVVRLGDVPDNAGGVRYPTFAETRDLALRMEEAGFDSLWVFDHLLYREPDEATVGIWEGWTVLSALAAVTQRIEVGPLVACTHFRNPALLAKMAATLDEVSGGRLILGLGAGWNQPEFDSFGIPYDHRLERFTEALSIIVPLLRDGHVDVQGNFYTARDAELVPRGPRQGGPPILIGCWGTKMLKLAARHADIWNGGYSGTIDTFRSRLDSFRAAQREAGTAGEHVEASALLKIGWQDLGEVPDYFEEEYVTGSSDEIAQVFRDYVDAGVSHVMCQYHPHTDEAFDRLTGALRAYRSSG